MEKKSKGVYHCFSWWKNLLSIDRLTGFPSYCKVKVGNGYQTSFWHTAWTHLGPLREAFPNLFSTSILQVVSIATMGGWQGGRWLWFNFGIPTTNIPSKQTTLDLQLLHNALEQQHPIQQIKDQVQWLVEKHDVYSVKSTQLSCVLFVFRLGQKEGLI